VKENENSKLSKNLSPKFKNLISHFFNLKTEDFWENFGSKKIQQKK
jgi:hypothetical protein